jgi:hypothetical protein
MVLYLKSLFGLLCTAVLIAWDPATPPPPHLGSYTRPLLVSQDRRHLFVTPWSKVGHGAAYVQNLNSLFSSSAKMPVADSVEEYFSKVWDECKKAISYYPSIIYK